MCCSTAPRWPWRTWTGSTSTDRFGLLLPVASSVALRFVLDRAALHGLPACRLLMGPSCASLRACGACALLMRVCADGDLQKQANCCSVFDIRPAVLLPLIAGRRGHSVAPAVAGAAAAALRGAGPAHPGRHRRAQPAGLSLLSVLTCTACIPCAVFRRLTCVCVCVCAGLAWLGPHRWLACCVLLFFMPTLRIIDAAARLSERLCFCYLCVVQLLRSHLTSAHYSRLFAATDGTSSASSDAGGDGASSLQPDQAAASGAASSDGSVPVAASPSTAHHTGWSGV